MKSQLFSLALLSGVGATALLDAQSGCCVEQCCIPEQKPCIDCECYTPAYYDLQCDCGIFFFADFLYWYARESALNYANVLNFLDFESSSESSGFPPTVIDVKNFGTSWEPGVRAGIGYNSSCDGWDLLFDWTYMKNDRSESLYFSEDAIKNSFFQPSWATAYNPLALLSEQQSSSLAYESLLAKWQLTFNQAELELGRKYWLSRCFSLRTYAGLRGAWIKTTLNFEQEFGSILDSQAGATSDFLLKDTITNTTWGVGFLTGIQPNWHFCTNFILYSNLDIALLWGEFENKEIGIISGDFDDPNIADRLATNIKLNPFGMHTAIDLGIGIRWEENWCCDRYKTSLDLGWEHHIWLGYNQRQQPIPIFGFVVNSNATRTDLMMGGLVIRARFDF